MTIPRNSRWTNHGSPALHTGLCLLTASAAIALGGCEPETTQRAESGSWSTKSQSVLGREEVVVPALSVDEASLDTGVVTDVHNAAVHLLEQAVNATNPLLRANAIEALQHSPGHVEEAISRGLVDSNRGVRFVAAMTLGRTQTCSLSHLAEPLLDDESQSVQAAAIYALSACNKRVDPTPLASMVLGFDAEAKANATLVLGELGNRSAVELLRSAGGQGVPGASNAQQHVIELQIAEALVKLGEQREREVIHAALFAPAEQGEIIALAAQILGRLNDRAAMSTLQELASATDVRRMPAEVRMAATAALAEMDPTQADLSVPMEYVSSDQFALRAQAALTLGAIGQKGSLQVLNGLLTDHNPMVQVSAASAILAITQEPGRAGVRIGALDTIGRAD